jgi:hypothetical protein
MKNANDLRGELASVFEELRSGAIKAQDAAELANVAGKMIASAKVQVEYYALRKEMPTIAFLNDGSGEACPLPTTER